MPGTTAGSGGPSGRRTTVATAAALTTTVLPVFLLGALSSAVGADLGLREVEIGAAITVLFVAAAVTATPAGRLAERIGAGVALRLGVVASGLATAAIGAFARSWWHLAVLMAVVGTTVAVVDTGAARAFSDGVRPGRQGLAFGVKEASVPGASLLAGLWLPVLGARLGWRSAFGMGLVVAVGVLVALPRRRGDARAAAAPTAPTDARTPAGTSAGAGAGTAALLRLAVGVGLAVGAATAAATFLVPTGTSRGLGPGAAGVVLSVASVASIVVRVLAGGWADRRHTPPVGPLATLMALGAAGAALLAVAGTAPVIVAGALLVLGAGWGWTGLAFLAAVRARPEAPASAAGIVLTGLAAGGALGPVAFGALAGGGSFGAAWLLTAVAMAAGAGATLSSRRALAPAG